ncbi:MAG: hypothetical protein ACKVPJ_13665 [Chitinophagales bacterium]
MEQKSHEGLVLWKLLEDNKVNRSELAGIIKKDHTIFNKWKNQKVIPDMKALKVIRQYFIENYDIDISVHLPRIPGVSNDSNYLVNESAQFYGNPHTIISRLQSENKDKEEKINILESEILTLSRKLNKAYEQIVNGAFEGIINAMNTQNQLSKQLLDSLDK